jgi:MFS family permease
LPAGYHRGLVNPLAPLADRDFRLYFTGEVLSSAGSSIHIVALGWYLFDRTGSATSVALVWAIGLGSGIVVLPFAGPLADRYPRRGLAIAADMARLVLVGAMAALAYAGSPSLPALYMLTFFVGLGHSVFWPSITALLQEVIRPEQLTAASGLVEVTWQAGSLTGAALGGPILVRFGLGTAFAIDAATYAISAVALLALHHRPAPAEGPHESSLAMARAGFGYLRRHPAVAGFGIASVIPWVATISLNVVLVAYVLHVLHLGATAYGLADMTYGVGAMVSGVFAALLVLRLGEWRAMTGVMVALIGCYAALAGAPAAVAAFYALLFLAGFCSSAFRVITSAYLFKVVPNEVMGRASSTFLLVSMLLQVIVTLSIGPLVNGAGARGGFVLLTAIVVAGLGLLAVVATAFHRITEAA